MINDSTTNELLEYKKISQFIKSPLLRELFSIKRTFLEDKVFNSFISVSQVENEKFLNTMSESIVTKFQSRKNRNDKYLIFGEKIKQMFQCDKNLTPGILSAMINNSIQTSHSTCGIEILNEVYYYIQIKKHYDYFSLLSIKDMLNRTPREDKTYIISEELKYIYYDHNTIKKKDGYPFSLCSEYITLKELKKMIEGKEQMRRPVGVEGGYYNYLPINCIDYCKKYYLTFLNVLQEQDDYTLKDFYEKLILDKTALQELNCLFYKNCIFSHNADEITYHPLKYKTKFCHNVKCSNKHCSYSHSETEINSLINTEKCKFIINELDRIFILEEKNNKERNFINKFFEKQLDHFKKLIPSYLKPEDIFLIKTEKCKNGVLCNDKKKCFYYHDELERRRSPKEIFIKNNQPCDKVFIDGLWKDPKKCEQKDECEAFHTRNELFYDFRNFRKLYACYYEQKSGKCEYIETCAYKHVTDIDHNELYLPNFYAEQIKNLSDKLNNVSQENNQLNEKCINNGYTCFRCNDYLCEKFIYFTCGHTSCFKCFSKEKRCSGAKCSNQNSELIINKDYFIINLMENQEISSKENEIYFNPNDFQNHDGYSAYFS